jgi:hypothetical protein
VVVEHGGYGAKFAAPIARELVEAAGSLNLLAPVDSEVNSNASVKHN